MKTPMLIAVVVAVLFSTDLQAQSNESITGTSEIRPGIPISDGELSVAVTGRVKRGDALRTALRFAAAEHEYRLAAQTARREGHLPSRTMWLLANAYYNDGDLGGAAAVLDQLATEAGRVGDLPIEALAVFNAAWLHGQAGRIEQAAARLDRLEKLLRSPYMPGPVRQYLSARLKTQRDVAAGR